MDVTLDQILLLAGALDETTGFDSARERFRRFLLDHVTHPDRACELIEQCQHAPGDQHQRALQDLVALLGRFLGFDVAFAPHARDDARLSRAVWRSRSRHRLILDIRSDQAAAAAFDSVLYSVHAVAESAGPHARLQVLCVLGPPYLGRTRLDEAIGAARAPVPIAAITLRSLLTLAALVTDGRVAHGDLIRLLEAATPLDFMTELLSRGGSPATASPSMDVTPEMTTGELPAIADQPSRFWLATVTADQGMKPEEVLELVVGKRRVFGVTGEPGAPRTARPGEWVCFHVPGKGVVGHARIAALGDHSGGLRAAHRFAHVLRLDHLTLSLAVPRAIDGETQLRLTASRVLGGRPAQGLIEISRESYMALTSARQAAGTGPLLSTAAVDAEAAADGISGPTAQW